MYYLRAYLIAENGKNSSLFRHRQSISWSLSHKLFVTSYYSLFARRIHFLFSVFLRQSDSLTPPSIMKRQILYLKIFVLKNQENDIYILAYEKYLKGKNKICNKTF